MEYKIIGMIHLQPLLGSDNYISLDQIIDSAIADIKAMQDGGIDAIMLENDSDSPYFEFLPLPQATCFGIVARALQEYIKIPFGYTVLLNDWQTALSLAKLTNAQFIRLDTYVDQVKRVSDGIELKPNPQQIQEFRQKICAENVKIFTDVHVKHTKMIDTQKSLEQSIDEALNHGSEGIIVTGNWTGEEPDLEELKLSKKQIDGRMPLIVGSGVNSKNIKKLMAIADMAIVGTSLKTQKKVDISKVKELVSHFKSNK